MMNSQDESNRRPSVSRLLAVGVSIAAAAGAGLVAAHSSAWAAGIGTAAAVLAAAEVARR